MYEFLLKDLAANGVKRRGLFGVFYGLVFNPGFTVVFWHRLSVKLKPIRLLSKLVCLHIAKKYGCYIASDARIGPGFCLPHPIGVVIGEKVEIGCNVRVYQNVTLGVRSTENRTVPKIDDSCVIYAGAVVVGACVLPVGAKIGANSLTVG